MRHPSVRLCFVLLAALPSEGWWSSYGVIVAAAEQLRGSNTHERALSDHHGGGGAAAAAAAAAAGRQNAIPVATVEVPLASKSGSHHAEIFVGQPPVPLVLIVDTGSRLTAWLCHDEPERSRKRRFRYSPANSTTVQAISCGACQFSGDSKCGKLEPRTTTSSAESSPPQQQHVQQDEYCIVKQRYTEGSSWTAYEVNDVLSLTAVRKRRRLFSYEDSLETTIPFTFGCQTAVTGLFKTQFAHGILGLERYSRHSLPVQLYQHGVTSSKAFSLCLSPTSGSLGLGGALKHKHLQPMQLTPLLQKTVTSSSTNKTIASGMYAVAVKEVWLGDTCLVSASRSPQLLEAFATGKGTILDSGTTDTFLPAALQKVFDTAWLEQTGKPVLQHHQSRTATYSIAEFRALPDIRFVFAESATLTVPAAHYMEGAAVFERYSQQQQNYVVPDHDEDIRHVLQNRVYTSEPVGAVLGINSMLGYDILYDTENERIGFAKSNC